MTAQEILQFQLDDVGHQLDASFAGLSDAQLDVKPSPNGMTPRETMVHLCECYEALAASCRGEKWPWGSYKVEDTSRESLASRMKELRQKGAEQVFSNPTEENLKHLCQFTVVHDAYHVGQLCIVNFESNPDWDPYSIYRM